MKKLLLFILTPIVLIASGGAIVYFLIKDTSTPSYVSNGETYETIMNDKIFDAFSKTKDNRNISISVTQDDFNQILLQAQGNLDETVTTYIKGLEINIEEDIYHLNVFLNANFIQTKLDLSCKFSQDENNFYLTVDNIKLGSLSNLKSISLSLLRNYISNEEFNSMFTSLNLPMEADLSNGIFTFKKEDIHNLILDTIKDEENKIPYAFVSDMFSLNYVNTDFNGELKVSIPLEDFHSNENFYNKDNELSEDELDLENNKNKLITLLNEQKIDTEHKEVVFKFLTLGYDSLSDEEKTYINSVDMTSIGYSNLSKLTHLGYTATNPNIGALILQNVTSILSSQTGFLINESYINQYVQYKDLIGYTYLMDKKTSTGYEINYITIDNFYVDLIKKNEKELMNMTIGLNINGYETSLILENEKTETISYGMKLKNENIYLGNYTLGDELTQEIYKLLKENLTDDDFMSFDGEGNFTISFEKDLKPLLSLTKNVSLVTTIEGENNSDVNAGIRMKNTITI